VQYLEFSLLPVRWPRRRLRSAFKLDLVITITTTISGRLPPAFMAIMAIIRTPVRRMATTGPTIL